MDLCYVVESIDGGTYQIEHVMYVYCVGRCSVLSECPVASFGGSVMSVHFGIKSLNHRQEQNKDEQNVCWPNWS